MTTAVLRDRTRFLIAGTQRGRSSTALPYLDAEINRALQTAREKLFLVLVSQPRPARVAVHRMVRTATGTTGTTVPAAFWALECGIRSGVATDDANGYIPAEEPYLGEALVGQNLDCIYAYGGKFYGTAATAVYWQKPTSDLTAADTALTDFSDAFYNVVSIIAALDLLRKDHPGNARRMQFLARLFKQRAMSLR